MSEYHQPYSEISKIPYEDLVFFVEYYNSKTKYEKYLLEKKKNETKSHQSQGRKLSFKKKPSMRSF